MPIKRRQLKAQYTYPFENAKMGYSVIGEGKPVILVHGSMISNPWNGVENKLAKSFKVYVPHLPGFGSSDAIIGKRHSTDLFVDALCAFISEVNLREAPVIALSLGAVVTVKSAVKGCIKGKLVLIGMPGKVENENLKKVSIIPIWLRRVLGSTTLVRKRILIPVVRDALGSRLDKKREDEVLKNMSEIDTRSLVDIDIYNEIVLQMPILLPKLSNQITFVYGANDKLIESTKDLISDAVIIEGAGHNVFRSQPDKLLAFLKEILQ